MQKSPDSEGASLQALKGVSDLKRLISLSCFYVSVIFPAIALPFSG